MRAKERLLPILPLAMSKSNVASKKVFTAPPLRKVHYYQSLNSPFSSWQLESFCKAQSSPSITMPEELEIPPFPEALQQQLEVIRGEIMPERWMCVVRREKINYAVGRIIHVGKVNHNLVQYIREIDWWNWDEAETEDYGFTNVIDYSWFQRIGRSSDFHLGTIFWAYLL